MASVTKEKKISQLNDEIADLKSFIKAKEDFKLLGDSGIDIE